MDSITLMKFYEKVGKVDGGGFDIPVYLDRSEPEGISYEITNIIGKKKNSYFFSALNNKTQTKFVLQMSYEKDSVKENFENAKRMMIEDEKYLIEPRESSISIQHLLLENKSGEKKIAFDDVIRMNACEVVRTTLKNKLEENFKIKLDWFIQLLKDLRANHSECLLHLDLKLEHLFLVDHQIKMENYVSKLKKEDFLKESPRISNSPGSIAPELFYDRDNVSTKSDIFSAGVAFCQFFSGSEFPDDLLKKSNELSDNEQGDFQGLFGDRPLEIRDPDLLALFIKNYRVFNFFKNELNKELSTGKLSDKERKILELLLTMIEIDPEVRPDVDRILFNIHKIEFAPESLINIKLKDRYIVQKLIDGGGRGIVYKVWDPIEETVRAIKLFPPQFNYIKDGFEPIRSELRYIPHRNIVNCYGLQRDGDLNFILLEYIKGFNLKEKLDAARGKKLKKIEALSIMRQVASALIESHRNGVIHRNLKDTNIMLTADDNRVKLINFGLSLKIKKDISETTGKDVMSSASLLVTPPEHLYEIWKEDDAQTDVWGFGILLYQLLMGRTPFDEKDLIRDPATIPAITGISDKTKAAIMKCLEKDRQRRYRNMEEVYEALFGGQPTMEDHEAEKQEGRPKISSFIQFFKKKWVRGLTGLSFGLIVAVLWLILGTNIFTGGEKYQMWYSGKPGNKDNPGGGIGYAASSDGIGWKRDKYNPIIPQGSKGRFNEFESDQPFVVHDEQFFHLMFRGSIKTGNEFEYHIGYMRFEKIARWTENNIDQVILDNGRVKFPGPMLYLDGLYKMWYTDNDAIYYACTTAKSQSIKDMVKNSDNPVLSKGNSGDWDQDGVIISAVLFKNEKFHMWYTGKSRGESKIGYATSGDGITWTKYGSNPVFDDPDVTLEVSPCVIYDSTGYKMYYSVAAGIEYYPVRLATSADGIQWKKYSNVPVLDTGSADWEKAKIFVTGIRVEKK